MTYSIVARDPVNGDLGVAVQSKFLGVGAVVPWARAGVGAVATQAAANVAYGPDGLAGLAAGGTARSVLQELIEQDGQREDRQVGIVDAAGHGASYTGRNCFRWAGGRIGEGYAAQGNILAGPSVVDAMVDRFVEGGSAFAELLVACLAAGDAEGGDRRGRQSAALLVVRADGGYGGGNDRWIDLRVDDHPDPIAELERILDLRNLYLERPAASDLLPLDDGLADEVRQRLRSIGAGPGGTFGAVYQPMEQSATSPAPPPRAVGVARPLPKGWGPRWQQALSDWMSVENLEERTAAAGWVDRRVLEFLRQRSSPTA